MTKFFEPINVSATHIYHSALELSPPSSLVRKLYYHQRLAPFPRVETGIPDSRDLSVSISSYDGHDLGVTWSPCGQFVATCTGVVQIWNALTLELVSTLQTDRSCVGISPSYLPDGRSLACVTHTGIVIWDIQTGGVVKESQFNTGGCCLLAWSSDGQVVGALLKEMVCLYNTTTNTTLDSVMPEPGYSKCLWAYGESFQVMKCVHDGKACVANIFDLGPSLIKIKSFSVLEGNGYNSIETFSPSTYRISGVVRGRSPQLFIFDIQNSERLLVERGRYKSPSFSPDGSYFAAFQSNGPIHIWNYHGNHYIPWRQFPSTSNSGCIVFSPSLPSFVVGNSTSLHIWHVNHFPAGPTACIPQLDMFSPSGTQIATAQYQGKHITITNPLQTISQSIDTGIKISGFGLTGNVLLVKATGVVMAWLLSEEGWVKNVLDNEGASQSNSIWTMPLSCSSRAKFSVEGDTGVISAEGTYWIYNARTGEVLEPTQEHPDFHGPWYSFKDNMQAKGYQNDSSIQITPPGLEGKPVQANLMEGWMKDHQGKCLLWLPTEWRVGKGQVQWLPNISTIKFKSKLGTPTIIKLQ